MNVSTERFARNQSIFREANERLRGVADPSFALAPYVCACSRAECSETIDLSLAAYDAIRSTPNTFVLGALVRSQTPVCRPCRNVSDASMLRSASSSLSSGRTLRAVA